MTQQKVYAGRRPTGKCVEIAVAGSTIERVRALPDDPSLPYVLPVLVDLQHNGALGTAFNDLGKTGPEKLEQIAGFLRRHGVGRCLMTTTSCDYEKLKQTMGVLDKRLSANQDLATIFFGMFHEGIFISPQDGWRGVHPKQWIQPPCYEKFKTLDDLSGNRIRIVNVAPEEPGGLDFIERAAADGKIVAMGHCCPTAQVVAAAVARGATCVTHFGNGAAPQIPRFKNPFWAFLDQPALRLGLICDGFHLPKEVVSVAFRCKGRQNCCVVSDAGSSSGCPPGRYEVDGDAPVVIEPNGRLYPAGNDAILAGAWFQLDRGVEFLVRELKMPFVEAWEQCSTIPAKIVGEKLPSLAKDQEASFVLARWQDDGILIEQSVQCGKPYLERPIRPTDSATGS